MPWGVIWDCGPLSTVSPEADRSDLLAALLDDLMTLAPGLEGLACFHRTAGATWEERAAVARRIGAAYGKQRLFLTLRWNAGHDATLRGCASYHGPDCDLSHRLAYGLKWLLERSMAPELPPYWRGYWMDACPLLLAVDGPAVRICPGFLTAATDCALLADRAFRRRLADAIVVALARNMGWRFLFLPGQEGCLDLDLRQPSGATARALQEAVRGTPLGDCVPAFLRAEAEHGVNALFLCAQALRNVERVPDLVRCKHNVLAYGAELADPFERAWTFRSNEEAIDTVAAALRRDFLDPAGGSYHGPTLKGVGLRYSDDPHWPYQVAHKMEQIHDR